MRTQFTRPGWEEVISMLAKTYPQCFFEEPKKRRPLKHNIIEDLQREGLPVACELMVAAVNWYQSHFSYQYALEAGAKRVDLNGREAGTVTEKEQNSAQKKIRDDQQKRSERNSNIPGRAMAALYTTGHISDEQLKKLDAPMKTKTITPAIAPELERLHEAFMAANTALLGSGDAVLRSALASAALGVVIEEAQRVIGDSTGD